MKSPFAGMTREQIHAELAKARAEKAKLDNADAKMNARILHAVRPGLFSKEHLAKTYFKSKHALVGIEGAERGAIREAMLENWGDKTAFVDAMSGKYDRSEAQWGALYDNELHISEGAADQMKANMNGATTKTWVTHPESSQSGPCPECEAMDGETVGIDEAYSNGDKIPGQNHPGCCCDEEYGD